MRRALLCHHDNVSTIRYRSVGAALGSVCVVVGLVGCAGPATEADGSATRPAPAATITPSPTPDAFTANGTLSLPIDEPATQALTGGAANVGGPCGVSAGYSDIQAGAEVLISDAAGVKIAVGHLEAGTAEQGSTDAVADGRCIFPFHVSDVPGASALYSVHVGNTFRGDATYDKHDLYQGVSLNIG